MPARGKTENTKKVQGNQRKADAAAKKESEVRARISAQEAEEWAKGAKSNKKQQDVADKKAEAARKKAERDALLAEEERNQRSTPKNAGAKTAQKKVRGPGLDLSQLDSHTRDPAALNATGIDNALDALSLTSNTRVNVDRHPERRYKAAYAAYEARRLPELDEETKGLRRNQKIDIVKREFDRSEENPFNQVHGTYDMTREQADEIRKQERGKVEGRLTGGR